MSLELNLSPAQIDGLKKAFPMCITWDAAEGGLLSPERIEAEIRRERARIRP